MILSPVRREPMATRMISCRAFAPSTFHCILLLIDLVLSENTAASLAAEQ